MANFNKDIEIEHVAKIIFEHEFDDSWHNVRMFKIEGDLYRGIAKAVLDYLEKYIEKS